MALFSLSDLTKPSTRAEVQASIYQVLAILGVNTTAWGSGAVVRTMIVGVSAILAAFSGLQAQIAQSGFLDLATGDWLTLVARYVYGVERIEATFAAGVITLANSGGGVYILDPGDIIVAKPVGGPNGGKAYRNTTAFVLNGSTTLTDIPISAVEAGSPSTAAAGEVTEMVTALLNVTCTNPAALVGLDTESDAALRVRCSEKLGALSPMGPWDAYAYAARNAKRSTGEPCGITRTRTLKDGFGNVTLVVASASGEVTGTIGDDTTDLGAVDEAVQLLAAPLAVTAHTESASAVSTGVTYELWAYNTSGQSNAQIAASVEAKLIAFTTAQPVGGNTLLPSDTTGYVWADAIKSAIASALSPQIFHVVVTLPAGDVALDNREVMVLGTVTPTIHQVASPEGGPS
jgi:phage-related baseplate assembly protein